MGSHEKKVLFVGSVSSGKTTLINSLFNYVKNDKYPTKVDIPIGMNVQYTMSPQTKSTGTEFVGPPTDRPFNQCLRSEKLKFEGDLYELIDTPGLNLKDDTHGLKKIRNAVYLHPHISTVCFVFEQSDFEQKVHDFCSYFLRSFPDLNYNNIIFCVTTTNKYHKLDDFNQTLNSIPQKIQEKLNREPLFCFNNFGFIHAVKVSLQTNSEFKNYLETEKIKAKHIWENCAQIAKAFLKAIKQPEGISNSSSFTNSLIFPGLSVKSGNSNPERTPNESTEPGIPLTNENKGVTEGFGMEFCPNTTKVKPTVEKDPSQQVDTTNASAADEKEKEWIKKQMLTISDLNTSKNELLKIVVRNEQENEKLKKKVEETEASLQKLTQLQADNEEIIRKKKEEKEKLEGEMKGTKELLQSSEAETNQLKQQLSDEKRVVTNLRKKLEDSDKRCKELEDEKNQEKAQFEEKERQLRDDNERHKQKSEKDLKDMEKLWKASEDQLKEDNRTMQLEKDDLSTSLRDQKMDFSNKSADFERSLSEKDEIIRKLRDDNQRLLTNVRHQMDIVSQLNKSNDDIKDLLNCKPSNQTIEKPLVKHIESKFSKDEKIILLLGETGVGKSTFINSALNYISHPNIYEAVNHEARILIPTHVDVYDEQYTRTNTKLFKHNINSHVVYDEKVSKGQSLTQKARYYRINDGHHKYVLIDTAGIGDTRGVDKDKENLNELKKFLRDEGVTHIHAVCILMHPNFKRLTEAMIYALNATVDFFGPQAYGNIFFCFTRTASTSFKPGDTLSALRDYLRERGRRTGRYLETDRSNVFCFENSCFREKLVYEMNMVRVPEQRTVEAWNKSVNSMNKLFDAIYSHEKPFDIPVGWYETRNN